MSYDIQVTMHVALHHLCFQAGLPVTIGALTHAYSVAAFRVRFIIGLQGVLR